MSESVNSPNHYNQGDIECIDVLIQLGIAKDFCRGNAIKYLWRCEDKNGWEDLKKAQWYLNKLIELEEIDQQSDAAKDIQSKTLGEIMDAVSRNPRYH